MLICVSIHINRVPGLQDFSPTEIGGTVRSCIETVCYTILILRRLARSLFTEADACKTAIGLRSRANPAPRNGGRGGGQLK